MAEIGRATCSKCQTRYVEIQDLAGAQAFMEAHAEHGGFVLLTEIIPPVPMILFCPRCGAKHIDQPAEECPPECYKLEVDPAGSFGHDKVCLRWTNPPHRSHECQACTFTFRHADIATTGVQDVQTHGKRDGLYAADDGRPEGWNGDGM